MMIILFTNSLFTLIIYYRNDVSDFTCGDKNENMMVCSNSKRLKLESVVNENLFLNKKFLMDIKEFKVNFVSNKNYLKQEYNEDFVFLDNVNEKTLNIFYRFIRNPYIPIEILLPNEFIAIIRILEIFDFLIDIRFKNLIRSILYSSFICSDVFIKYILYDFTRSFSGGISSKTLRELFLADFFILSFTDAKYFNKFIKIEKTQYIDIKNNDTSNNVEYLEFVIITLFNCKFYTKIDKERMFCEQLKVIFHICKIQKVKIMNANDFAKYTKNILEITSKSLIEIELQFSVINQEFIDFLSNSNQFIALKKIEFISPKNSFINLAISNLCKNVDTLYINNIDIELKFNNQNEYNYLLVKCEIIYDEDDSNTFEEFNIETAILMSNRVNNLFMYAKFINSFRDCVVLNLIIRLTNINIPSSTDFDFEILNILNYERFFHLEYNLKFSIHILSNIFSENVNLKINSLKIFLFEMKKNGKLALENFKNLKKLYLCVKKQKILFSSLFTNDWNINIKNITLERFNIESEDVMRLSDFKHLIELSFKCCKFSKNVSN
ncbi:hypothetical protein CWI37_0353p0030 [Hamiltosporidium tvaerminnensis]|uniref:BTB domain-containing protein n=1 Tax=Hamiltosporidium tvaerminnensis TaxID=1176355 RepID=A0A4Q9L669_9MICR|nr:hypothetical protein CWI37_0353p0030 [Hamiltosporidium tvaerminnensis]